MKKTLLVGAVLFAKLLSAHAEPNETKIYLRCMPDSSERLSGPTDLLLDKKTLEGKFVIINEKMQFKESETEFFTRMEFDGKLAFEFAVNKFTLRYRNYNTANALVSESPSTAGQCVIQQKKL